MNLPTNSAVGVTGAAGAIVSSTAVTVNGMALDSTVPLMTVTVQSAGSGPTEMLYRSWAESTNVKRAGSELYCETPLTKNRSDDVGEKPEP